MTYLGDESAPAAHICTSACTPKRGAKRGSGDKYGGDDRSSVGAVARAGSVCGLQLTGRAVRRDRGVAQHGEIRGTLQRAQKAVAIAAAGVVLLGGAAVTSLAAWTDTEYVNGGVGTVPGIGTSTFEVEQNVVGGAGDWTNDLASPGGVIDFGLGAIALSPDTTVYGGVMLRTTAASTVGGTLSLVGAADDGDLFDALTYGARIVPTLGDCDATGFDGSATVIVANGAALSANGTSTFTLASAAAETKVACFAVNLPAGASETLMGEVSNPVWSFSAISN